MLPAEERLRRAGLFKRAYAARQTVSCPLFTLYVLPRTPGAQPRFPLTGFVAGKKVHNKAVHRNLAKRRVREAYRKLREGKPELKQWYCLVWVLKDVAVQSNWDEIYQQVEKLLDLATERRWQSRRSV